VTYERELELTAERLRQLPAARLVAGEVRFYGLVDRMTTRRVPRLQPRAWGDQLLLIGGEVPPGPAEDFTGDLVELRRSFDITPSQGPG
jgi:hypothetical protein